MFFDPQYKVVPEPVTKPDIFALPTLIAWLETMPAELKYNYFGTDGWCLLGHFFTSLGHPVASIGGTFVSFLGAPDDLIDLPFGFQEVAAGKPRTYGASLGRARLLAHAAAAK